MTAFATPRAGATHPATDTVARYWLPAGSTGSAAPAQLASRSGHGQGGSAGSA